MAVANAVRLDAGVESVWCENAPHTHTEYTLLMGVKLSVLTVAEQRGGETSNSISIIPCRDKVQLSSAALLLHHKHYTLLDLHLLLTFVCDT